MTHGYFYKKIKKLFLTLIRLVVVVQVDIGR